MSKSSYETGTTGEYEVIDRIGHGMSRAAPPIGLTSRLVDLPPSYYMVGAIDRIEARVDALMNLRAKDAISESVFSAALAAIQNDTRLVLLLDTLNSAWRGASQLKKKDFTESPDLGHPEHVDLRNHQTWERAADASMRRYLRQDVILPIKPPHGVETERQKAEFQELETRIKEQANKKVEQVEHRLAELRAAYPRLEALLAELER